MENSFNDVQNVSKRPAAEDLAGVVVGGRFRLERTLHVGKQESGGNFGVGYVATDLQDGNKRFVKLSTFESACTRYTNCVKFLNGPNSRS